MRLPRPHIPIHVRVQVAERQMLAMTECTCTDQHGIPLEAAQSQTSFTKRLEAALFHLSRGATVKLHLDHDPPLGARVKIKRNGKIVGYVPAANDPDHLFYREVESHKLKTNVRGDGAQYPDRVLIKRQKRREREETAPLPKRWRATTRARVPPRSKRKTQWPSGRKMQSRPFERRAK